MNPDLGEEYKKLDLERIAKIGNQEAVEVERHKKPVLGEDSEGEMYANDIPGREINEDPEGGAGVRDDLLVEEDTILPGEGHNTTSYQGRRSRDISKEGVISGSNMGEGSVNTSFQLRNSTSSQQVGEEHDDDSNQHRHTRDTTREAVVASNSMGEVAEYTDYGEKYQENTDMWGRCDKKSDLSGRQDLLHGGGQGNLLLGGEQFPRGPWRWCRCTSQSVR